MVNITLSTLYENELFQIELDKQLSLLQLTFRQNPDLEHFRNAYLLAIDAAQSKEVRYWLTDARQIKVMLPENQSWLKQNMMPLLQSFRIRRFAIVMAPECFVMTNPTQVYNRPEPEKEKAPTGLIKVHFDLDAAKDWLFENF